MKKIIIFFLILGIGILFLTSTRITSKNYYHWSKSKRQEVIKKLSQNCLSEDITGLQVTYKEILNDLNATKCWTKYFEKCLMHRDKNLTLKIPIICPSY